MIRTLILRNAGPFKGDHVVELGPMAYAITARYESDPGRSNWSGKSFIQEMIDFALTGRLNKDRRYDADGWITRDEREGLVGVELEGGYAIVRSRRRGKPTQIRFKQLVDGEAAEFFRVPGNDAKAPAGTAAQDEAEHAMLKYLSFDADDFRQLAYFEQGKMARLVLTEPEKRMEIVRGWLGIEKAERAELECASLLVDRVREVQRLRQRRAVVDEWLEQLKDLPDERALVAERDRVAALVIRMQGSYQVLRDAAGNQRNAARTIERYEVLVAAGKDVVNAVASFPSNLDELAAVAKKIWDAKNVDHVNAQREALAKKKVSLGLFDGRCPVAPIDCPAKRQINDNRDGARVAYQAAAEVELDAFTELEAARRAARDVIAQADDAKRTRMRLEHLRADVAQLMPEVKIARKTIEDGSEGFDDIEGELAAVRIAHQTAVSAVADARAKHVQREKLIGELASLTASIDREAAAAATATRTRAVFRATQRRVAERALGDIGTRANDMLLGAGIDLNVDVRWEYEGKGLARACEDCGAAFPASAKVKKCESCGAERGQNVVRKLEFIRSDTSGAANDIAGVSLQLAAGSWLLASRHSPWATLLIDEPFSQCDKTNRQALSRSLAAILRSGGTPYRQALIISHTPDTVEALQSVIEIVVNKDGSRSIRQMKGR